MVIKRAVPAEVERLVRLMEAHCDGDQWQRLRAAAKAWEDNGGKFSSPVVAEDDTTPSPVASHRSTGSTTCMDCVGRCLTSSAR